MAKESSSLIGSFFRRTFRTFRLLFELHLQLAQKEAKQDTQRILSALMLLIVAVILLSFVLLLAHGAALLLAQKHLHWDLTQATLALALFDLLAALLLTTVARSQLKKPLMPETKALLQKTVNTLKS